MSHPSILMLEKAANILRPLKQRIIFTGGATIALYLDEISAEDARPTIDVDCVLEIASKRSYYSLAETLRQLGLQESHDPGDPLCRWKYEDLILVKAHLKAWFRATQNDLQLYAPAHLSPESKNSGREQLLLQRLQRLAKN